MAWKTHGIDFVYYAGATTPDWKCDTLGQLVDSILAKIEPLGGSIVGLVQYGPGGGNPMFTFRFQTREGAIEFLTWYNADQDDVAYLVSLLIEV